MARKRTWLEWLNPFSRVQGLFTFFAFVWFVGATFLLYLAFTRDGVSLHWPLAIYLLSTVACSLIVFVLYGIDKRQAVREKSRISERTLHMFSVFGGWPGAHLARGFFRHKTQKMSFRLVFWLIVAIHMFIIGYGLFLGYWVNAIRALMSSASQ